MIAQTPVIRLPLSEAANARDLGGYPTYDNSITKFNRFVRSDYPISVNSNDAKLLKEKNIGVIKMEVMRNHLPENNFLQKVRDLATKNNIVLIFDECTSFHIFNWYI